MSLRPGIPAAGGGLFVFIDEMSKFLEAAAHDVSTSTSFNS